MKLYLSVLVLFIFLAIAFVFGTQNEQLIELNYIVAKSRMSVAMAVSIFTLIGFVIGLMTMFSIMLSRKIKRLRKSSSK
ncbi:MULTISPECIES: LapA family protein [unclassified Thalassotalea]|uniref:lipopolysaccharide assembly protein LapA domain-containing protein n=1 Tax=unclassified Thalassotalea TaxID=2614972 RepID=UPI00145C5E30|nr:MULTISPECIES: LapA family protein [unclassified Thalassotalea]NMP15577.1 LapA family protein [Thalassotalea sp. Y01]